jgi:hypothetical protein
MKKLFLLLGILFVIAVAYYIHTIFNGTIWGEIRAKENTIEYLQEKYQMEFDVHNVEYSFKNHNYVVLVYPKNNSSLIFGVEKQKNNSGEIEYVDNYLEVLKRTNQK